jgi:ribosomal protein S18 acetylase RimI-like enzyme
MVFGRLRRAERRRQISEALAHAALPDSRPFAGLIVARRGSRLVGTVLCQLEPGRTAIVWLPRLIASESPSTAAALLAAIWEFLAQQSVVLAQVLLSTVDKNERAILRAGKFYHLANLLYLVSPEGSFPTAPPATPLEFEPYCEANHRRWQQVLAATYEGTLDCPGLAIVRDPEDVLAGYRASGAFDPRYWLLVRSEDRDVGCLLLADHPRHDSMEVLYLGLIPAARGRGWGKQLARRAQWLAGLAGRQRLLLAVDAANRPATETYMAAGFQTWQRRRLYVKELGSADYWHASFQQVFHAGRPAAGANFDTVPTPT